MITWYTAPAVGIPRGRCQMPCTARPGPAATSVTVPVPVSTGLGSSHGASATRSDGYAWKQPLTWLAAAASTRTPAAIAAARRGQVLSSSSRANASARPARATHDHSTTVNGSKSGNGRQTLLISHVSKAMTPPAAITMSGTQITSQRTEAAPPALPPRAPRLKEPRLGALRPAASQANASSALTSKMTGSGPAINDQSSGFIALITPGFRNAPRVSPNHRTLVPLAWLRGNGPAIDRNRDRDDRHSGSA